MKVMAESDWIVMTVEICGKHIGADVASEQDIPQSGEVSSWAYSAGAFSLNY